MIRNVRIENGLVRGIEGADPRITAFKGIPFAAPPVGKNRWRAPQPCDDWDGELEAYRFAPISVQDTPGLGTDIYCREWHVDPQIPMDEDCLYLNVWTNAKSTSDKLPVVVWYYGGGLQWGYPAEMEFDGENLAKRGIIVVTVNYRINVFGFLAHSQLSQEQSDAPTNFGSLDQQAGLRWVKRNIEQFGGDPNNITIAGQSAGGGSVMSQMTCPDNFGDFQKAIVQSGMIRSPYQEDSIGTPKSLQEAERNGENFFSFIGVNSLEQARELDAFYIRDKYAEYAKEHPRMATVIDHKFCFGDPLVLYMQKKHAGVPILAGNTADEFPNYIEAKDEKEFEEKAKKIFGEKAEQFLAFEEAKLCGEKQYGLAPGIECTIKSLIQDRDDCYYYRFDADIPGWDHPGTFHSVELWFFFETLAKCWRPFRGRHYDLSRLMCNYWSNFVKNGNPNGMDDDGTKMPEWNPYTKEQPCNMIFRCNDLVIEQREETEYMSFLIEAVRNLLLNS